MSESNTGVRLRLVEPNDLPTLFEFQLDAESNQIAFTHPRSKSEFDAHWAKALEDSSVVAKAIVVDGKFVGCISCFECDGLDSIGYWIGRTFWGKGIATQALELLLNEVDIRPLSAASERYVECEEVIMELAQ